MYERGGRERKVGVIEEEVKRILLAAANTTSMFFVSVAQVTFVKTCFVGCLFRDTNLSLIKAHALS